MAIVQIHLVYYMVCLMLLLMSLAVYGCSYSLCLFLQLITHAMLVILLYVLVNGTRVVGFKLLSPPLILIIVPPFSLIYLFLVVLYSEDYGLIAVVDMVSLSLIVLYGSYGSYSSFSLLSYVSVMILNYVFVLASLAIKAFLSVSMIVGNLIDVYLFGLIAVMISWLLVLGSFGLVLGGFLLYFFLTDVEVFLCLLFLLELFSSVFQSVTLANRLSINLIAGSLLTSLLSLAVIVFLSLYYWIVISFCLFSISIS